MLRRAGLAIFVFSLGLHAATVTLTLKSGENKVLSFVGEAGMSFREMAQAAVAVDVPPQLKDLVDTTGKCKIASGHLDITVAYKPEAVKSLKAGTLKFTVPGNGASGDIVATITLFSGGLTTSGTPRFAPERQLRFEQGKNAHALFFSGDLKGTAAATNKKMPLPPAQNVYGTLAGIVASNTGSYAIDSKKHLVISFPYGTLPTAPEKFYFIFSVPMGSQKVDYFAEGIVLPAKSNQGPPGQTEISDVPPAAPSTPASDPLPHTPFPLTFKQEQDTFVFIAKGVPPIWPDTGKTAQEDKRLPKDITPSEATYRYAAGTLTITLPYIPGEVVNRPFPFSAAFTILDKSKGAFKFSAENLILNPSNVPLTCASERNVVVCSTTVDIRQFSPHGQVDVADEGGSKVFAASATYTVDSNGKLSITARHAEIPSTGIEYTLHFAIPTKESTRKVDFIASGQILPQWWQESTNRAVIAAVAGIPIIGLIVLGYFWFVSNREAVPSPLHEAVVVEIGPDPNESPSSPTLPRPIHWTERSHEATTAASPDRDWDPGFQKWGTPNDAADLLTALTTTKSSPANSTGAANPPAQPQTIALALIERLRQLDEGLAQTVRHENLRSLSKFFSATLDAAEERCQTEIAGLKAKLAETIQAHANAVERARNEAAELKSALSATQNRLAEIEQTSYAKPYGATQARAVPWVRHASAPQTSSPIPFPSARPALVPPAGWKQAINSVSIEPNGNQAEEFLQRLRSAAEAVHRLDSAPAAAVLHLKVTGDEFEVHPTSTTLDGGLACAHCGSASPFQMAVSIGTPGDSELLIFLAPGPISPFNYSGGYKALIDGSRSVPFRIRTVESPARLSLRAGMFYYVSEKLRWHE
jgi:hypothetical protein